MQKRLDRSPDSKKFMWAYCWSMRIHAAYFTFNISSIQGRVVESSRAHWVWWSKYIRSRLTWPKKNLATFWQIRYPEKYYKLQLERYTYYNYWNGIKISHLHAASKLGRSTIIYWNASGNGTNQYGGHLYQELVWLSLSLNFRYTRQYIGMEN